MSKNGHAPLNSSGQICLREYCGNATASTSLSIKSTNSIVTTYPHTKKNKWTIQQSRLHIHRTKLCSKSVETKKREKKKRLRHTQGLVLWSSTTLCPTYGWPQISRSPKRHNTPLPLLTPTNSPLHYLEYLLWKSFSLVLRWPAFLGDPLCRFTGIWWDCSIEVFDFWVIISSPAQWRMMP